MNTPLHTPGPWKWAVESNDPEWAVVTTQGGRIVANVNAEGGVTDAGQPARMPRDSNARLIAAAPDLLELVIKAFERFTDNDMQPPNRTLSEWLAKASDTLAKATQAP